MARPAPTAITAKMYRHFAVLTLVATLGLAMFAEGENREAIAREVQQETEPNPDRTPNDFVRKDSKQHGSFGTDDWVGGEIVPSSTSSAPSPPEPPLAESAKLRAGMPVGHTVYGMSAADWAALNEEQKSEVIAHQLQAQDAMMKPERQQQIDKLLAASRARSGGLAAAPD